MLIPAILVEENAVPPRGGFGVPAGYKIVVGKLPWEQAPGDGTRDLASAERVPDRIDVDCR